LWSGSKKIISSKKEERTKRSPIETSPNPESKIINLYFQGKKRIADAFKSGKVTPPGERKRDDVKKNEGEKKKKLSTSELTKGKQAQAWRGWSRFRA